MLIQHKQTYGKANQSRYSVNINDQHILADKAAM